MKALSKMRMVILGTAFLVCCSVLAATPGRKRTIFTSGEKVFQIYYQLGQSTVLYLGVKPEVVICGNKNYFNIEKLKEGVTIQPLSSISTNLNILSGNKRYLFYLMPASAGLPPDGFIDVKWITASSVKAAPALGGKAEIVREINQTIEVRPNLSLTVQRQISFVGGNKIILEMELKAVKQKLNANDLTITAFLERSLIKDQVLIWEKDLFVENESIKGRLILIKAGLPKTAHLNLSVSLNGRSIKVGIPSGKN